MPEQGVKSQVSDERSLFKSVKCHLFSKPCVGNRGGPTRD